MTCTCMSFALDDVNNFVVGSEEGIVYTASRHGNKGGINDGYESKPQQSFAYTFGIRKQYCAKIQNILIYVVTCLIFRSYWAHNRS